jgi:chromosome segregation ATPase
MFQGCGASKHLNGSSEEETKKFKIANEEMRNEIERLKIKNFKLQRQIGILEKENQRMSDEDENQIARMRDQNAVLNQQIDKLEEENQRIRDENQALAKKIATLQLEQKAPSSESHESEKEDYETELMYVQKRSVRLRNGPGIEYQTVDGLRLGDRVLTKELEGDWYRVIDPEDFNKTIGWIHRSLLGKMPPGP